LLRRSATIPYSTQDFRFPFPAPRQYSPGRSHWALCALSVLRHSGIPERASPGDKNQKSRYFQAILGHQPNHRWRRYRALLEEHQSGAHLSARGRVHHSCRHILGWSASLVSPVPLSERTQKYASIRANPSAMLVPGAGPGTVRTGVTAHFVVGLREKEYVALPHQCLPLPAKATSTIALPSRD
jgi:hypothetical protein